jgi:hypothetical protein
MFLANCGVVLKLSAFHFPSGVTQPPEAPSEAPIFPQKSWQKKFRTIFIKKGVQKNVQDYDK